MCALVALNEDEIFCRQDNYDLEDEIRAYEYVVRVVYQRLKNSRRINQALNFEDCHSIGLEALWRAIITYDPARGQKSTYFFHVVEWAMQRLSMWRGAGCRADWNNIAIEDFESNGESGAADFFFRQASFGDFQNRNVVKKIFRSQICRILKECVAAAKRQSGASSKKARIMARRCEILKKRCQGLSLREISKEFKISHQVVSLDLKAIYAHIRRCLKKNYGIESINECLY